MKPEEIDSLFKEKLGNTAPTPPADLWNRLQDRMAPEMPLQIKPKEEKRSFMWIYSSVAASLSLLLSVGIVFYNIKSNPEVSETLADKDKVVLEESPVYTAPAQETIAQVSTDDENKSETQATDITAPASVTVEKVAETNKKRALKSSNSTKKETVKQKASVQQAIARNTTPSVSPAKNEEVVPASASKDMAALDMNAQPVEITIKRTVAASKPVYQQNEPDGLTKKAHLAKNIFKQVRNLANGEHVELEALGINADKVALQTQIGKQKFSKVINL